LKKTRLCIHPLDPKIETKESAEKIAQDSRAIVVVAVFGYGMGKNLKPGYKSMIRNTV
jgi:NAD(P)H-hydrate repair Nnr-like enzyme with NAD(P)H-hydrate epimerase domain